MNILSLNYEDLGGLSYNLCTAINGLTDHRAVSAVMASTWVRYPMMVGGKKAIFEGMSRLLDDADVVHINERPELISLIGAKPEDCRGKKIIFHGHGSKFRRRSPRILKMLYSDHPNATVIVSTPNLLSATQEATWFPSVIPIEHYRAEYPTRRNEPPLFYASHTKAKRHRPILIEAENDLRQEGLGFSTRWITGIMHAANLKQKAQADIYLNSIKPFYGIDVLEASAFEMAIVTGMNEFSMKYIREHEIDCPYLVANTLSEMKEHMRELILDRSFREDKGKQAYEYVQRMHSPKVGVERFIEICEETKSC